MRTFFKNLFGNITWITVLSNSMKLQAMPCRITQDGRDMVKSSDKMWSTGEGNGKSFQDSCLENTMNSMKRQKDIALKDEQVGRCQHATGEEYRNNSRSNEKAEPMQEQCPFVHVSGDESKV